MSFAVRAFLALAIAGTACAVLPAPSRANDSSATLAAGGIVLVRNDAIEMAQEDLFISPAEVRVRYVFRNTADSDQTLLVAFPLPTLPPLTDDNNVSFPETDDPDNPFDFHTEVDGRPVEMTVERRAVALGIDRAALLKSLGLPLAPYLPATNAALDRLPPEKQRELAGLGLATFTEYDVGKGMERHLEPLWSLDTVYYWQQVFPAHGEVVVTHRYRPSVGMSAGTMLADPKSPEARDAIARYCIEKSFLASVARIEKAEAAKAEPHPLMEQHLDYILTTGNNWRGPIGRFRLEVDKGKPENLVSFCGSDVRKIGPTRFEMTATDFFPPDDLAILILTQ